MGFGGIVALLVKNAVKSAVKFELAIDPIIAKFTDACPSKSEIDKILKQKNQLSQAVTQIETALTSIDKTGSTIDGIVKGVKIGVTILKTLPAPTSVPPGVGIPLNIINGFSDSLDLLGVLLKEFGGVTSQISPSIEIITKTLATVNAKLATLDGLLAGCLQSETEGMTDLEKEEFFQSLGIDLSSADTTGGSNNPNSDNPNSGNPNSGNPNDPNNSGNSNETLENRLSPNSTNPIVYKGFTITLDNDAGNKFSFPSRRAIGVNGEGVKIVTPFSFSSSTQVLIDSIEFQINQTDSLELARLANESRVLEIQIEENYETVKAQAGIKQTFFQNQIDFASKQKPILTRYLYLPEIERLYNLAVGAYEQLIEISPTLAQSENIQGIIDDLTIKNNKAKVDFARTLAPNLTAELSQVNFGSFFGVNAATVDVSNSYDPIGRPGSVNGEVVFKGGQAWRFLGGTPDKWVKHTVSFSPFTEGGGNKTKFRDKTIKTGKLIRKETYRWDPKLQKWLFVSSTTL